MPTDPSPIKYTMFIKPNDRIIVTAGAPSVPQSLIDQLAIGGRLVVPIGNQRMQELLLITKDEMGSIKRVSCGNCMFVPLLGEEGWKFD